MRLWHQNLIHKLPRAQLLGQHRECCALRGLGWGRKHKTVDYVFGYPKEYLIAYHTIVMWEMQGRGYKVNDEWFSATYRGLRAQRHERVDVLLLKYLWEHFCLTRSGTVLYREHNDTYLQECLDNLRSKGVELS